MFMPVALHSVNSASSLPPGRYAATCARYGHADEPLIAMVFRFTLVGDDLPAAVDLLVIEPDGTMRARDFLWMPDRSWRDSDGARANSLEALLPAEILELQFVRSEVLEAVTVGGPQ